MDHSIKAVWYDLDEGQTESHLSWLHEIYLPALLTRPGYLWIAHYQKIFSRSGDVKPEGLTVTRTNDPSVGAGDTYFLLIGAASPDVFFGQDEEEFHARQSNETKEMLSQRIGVRTCVFLEETRVDGPEIGMRHPGTTPGPIAQLEGFNPRQFEDEFELARWYRQHRLPVITRTPGCIGARKLVSVAGWAKHGIFYEFTSVEERRDNFEEKVEWGSHRADAKPVADLPEWSGRHPLEYLIHSPGSAFVGSRIWPAN